MPALDTDVFNNIKTFADYNKADQAFQIQKALQAQQLQTGSIDAATKANIYKTQMLAGAVAGGQPAYDQARQNLQEQGIDTSEFAPDVQTASTQINAARLAQAPAMQLLSAAQKDQTNQIALAGLTGKITPGAQSPTIPGLLGAGGIVPVQLQQPAATPQTTPPVQSAAPNPQGISDVLNPGGAAVPPVNVQASIAGTNLTPSGALPGTEQPSAAPAPPSTPPPTNAPAVATPRFSPPAQNPGETLAAYNARVQQAFEAYKSDPAYLAAAAHAGETGKTDAENANAAAKADQLTSRLQQNLQAMLKLNPDVPSGGLIPASAKAYMSQAGAANGIGTGRGAIAADQWDQINNQQIISEIQQFVASGGANTRINQTLDKMIRAASGIDKNALPASREAQIKNALAEIENKNVSAGNLAGGDQPYAPIPVQTAQPLAAIPMAAAQFLKANPGNADQFDAKYGAGASKMVLGQ